MARATAHILPGFPLTLERIHDFIADTPFSDEIERDDHGDDDPERDLHLVAPDVAKDA